MVNAAGGLQVYYHVRGNQHVTSDGCQFISRFSAGGLTQTAHCSGLANDVVETNTGRKHLNRTMLLFDPTLCTLAGCRGSNAVGCQIQAPTSAREGFGSPEVCFVESSSP